jgi:DNA-binding NtrC family response regulator
LRTADSRRGKVKKVLIVDDDEALLFAFKRIFRASNVVVYSADSVERAIELVAQEEFALVITDLRFSDEHPEGGLEVIRYIKEHSPKTITVLWTAYGVNEDAGHLRESGVDYHLKKPVPSDTIRDIMQQVGVGE